MEVSNSLCLSDEFVERIFIKEELATAIYCEIAIMGD